MKSLLTITLGLLVISSAYAESTVDRIQAVGKVRTEVSTAAPAVKVASTGGEGKAIYNKHCTVCHASGVAGAPKLGDAAAWQPRIAQGKATIFKHAKHGLNAMPPKGTCMECSDKALQAAIDYMIKNSG